MTVLRTITDSDSGLSGVGPMAQQLNCEDCRKSITGQYLKTKEGTALSALRHLVSACLVPHNILLSSSQYARPQTP